MLQEFKTLLESIEIGLYEKWKANLINNENHELPKSEIVEGFLDYYARDNYIVDAFPWNDSNEDDVFWENVDKNYRQALLDKYGY